MNEEEHLRKKWKMLAYMQKTYGAEYSCLRLQENEGSSNACFLARERAGGADVFIKTFDFSVSGSRKLLMDNELFWLNKLRGEPYVCALRRSHVDVECRVGIVVQDAFGAQDDIIEIVNEAPCRTGERHAAYVRAYFAAVLRILSELERRGIVHGDIKSDNILYSAARAKCCLADFEFAVVAGTAHVLRGTPPYVDYAQMLAYSTSGLARSATCTCERVTYRTASDLWALAMSVYRMLFVDVPFSDESMDHCSVSAFRHALLAWPAESGRFIFPPCCTDAFLSPPARACVAAICACLTPTYDSRPRVAEVLALLNQE